MKGLDAKTMMGTVLDPKLVADKGRGYQPSVTDSWLVDVRLANADGLVANAQNVGVSEVNWL